MLCDQDALVAPLYRSPTAARCAGGAWPQPSDDAPAVWSRRGATGSTGVTGDVEVATKHPLRVLTWHHQGDYFATVAPSALTSAVLVHQQSKKGSQALFKRNKGKISAVAFHPLRPLLFVATQRHVHVYNLVKQQLVKKLIAGVAAINSIAVHPKGDNLIVGSSDRKARESPATLPAARCSPETPAADE